MGDQELTHQPPQQATRQIPVNSEDEMRTSYLDYAKSVIIGRELRLTGEGGKCILRSEHFQEGRQLSRW